jgi:hypothetical protein
MVMILKPQDIVVLLKLVAINDSDWSYNSLANDLAMSPAEVHAGIKRCVAARLFNQQRNAPIRSALLEFLVHGVKYVFLPDRGALTRGIPTGYAAPPLNSLIVQTNEPPPVGLRRRGRSVAMSSPPCTNRFRRQWQRTLCSMNCSSWSMQFGMGGHANVILPSRS